jgi:hypothetical protein
MGLLDDAIREHLDLKRRRGGDPAEIERAEREALGPVRRGPEVAEEDAAADEAVFHEDAGHLAEDAPGPQHAGTEPERWEPFQEDAELHALEEHEDELPPYEPAHGPGGDPLIDEEELPPAAAQPAPHPADLSPGAHGDPSVAPFPAEPPSEPAPSHLEQETEEYDIEHEPTDEDVLETTPEFLQDAPDHDRLWFEQRPPRDFDFDG